MGKEFIPTLIQTTTWEAYRWIDLEKMLNDEFHKLAEKEDIEAIFNAVKNWSRKFEKKEQEVKEKIRSFLWDINWAGGVVATSDPLYQEVILAILDTFGE
jgi:hypothetical protein